MKRQKEMKFCGPLFIVGVSRSGTKLLRDILNNHSKIALIPIESQIIPFFYYKFNNYGDIRIYKNFEKFYSEFSDTLFFHRLKDSNIFIDENYWYKSIDEWSYSGVLKAFYQIYLIREKKEIWGDKTPGYLLHILLLKKLFPQAKFINIIRDVRDVCLSANRTWGRNIYRTAQRWVDHITKCREDAKKYSPSDYLEIKYEELVKSPQKNIKEVCEFLNISFEKNMLFLKKPTESVGNAKDHIGILKSNTEKWKTALKIRQIKKIERICYFLLKDLEYELQTVVNPKKLNKFEMVTYSIFDLLKLISYDIKNQKLKKGFWSLYKRLKMRSAQFR